MKKVLGEKVVYNGEIVDNDSDKYEELFISGAIYEVVRIVEGRALFLEDHIERLNNSCRLSNRDPYFSSQSITGQVYSLINALSVTNHNIRISYIYDTEEPVSLIHLIETSYPTSEMYRSGVKTILYRAERANPEAKVSNIKMRSDIAVLLLENDAFEALLVNQNGSITEGSRSNMFFVKGNTIVTAPDSEVLGGVTRKHILNLIASYHIDLELRALNSDELGDVNSLFLSGTSPQLLPIRQVDNHYYKVNSEIINRLRSGFLELVDSYIRRI